MHLFLIITGYSSIFLMVVIGIRWFQRDSIIQSRLQGPDRYDHHVHRGLLRHRVAIMYGHHLRHCRASQKKSKPMYKSSHSHGLGCF